MEKLRVKDDAINTFVAGMFTSMVLQIGYKTNLFSLIKSGIGGGLFGAVMYKASSLFSKN